MRLGVALEAFQSDGSGDDKKVVSGDECDIAQAWRWVMLKCSGGGVERSWGCVGCVGAWVRGCVGPLRSNKELKIW